MNEELIKNIKKELNESLAKDVKRFVEDTNTVRGIRVNIESIRQINVHELNSKLSHIANIFNVQRELIVEPFEKKNFNIITKAILESNLGYKLEKSNIERIYFSLMPLNQEIKNKIIVSYKQKTEEAKISVRKTRQKALNSLKFSKLSSDQEKRTRREIDELTKKSEVEMSKICEKKTSELLNF